MAGSITTLTALRDLIATTLGTVSGLTVYKDGATILDSLPAVEMRLPEVRRVPVDQQESQLGTVTWETTWPMTLYVVSDEVSNSGDACLQNFALILAAFDASETLGTTASTGFSLMCRLTEARESTKTRTGDVKPTRGYDMLLEVWQLV